jgi:hypothetical protein
VVWYDNNGSLPFTKYVISDNSGIKIQAYDWNSDGYPEVVSSDYYGDAIYLYNNSGNPTGTWTTNVIGSTNPGYEIQIADIDNDGDMDIFATSPYESKMIWLEKGAGWSFTSHDLASGSGMRGLGYGDINGDGWNDSVGGLGGSNQIYWYINDHTPASGSWTGYQVESSITGPSGIMCADIDNNGTVDIVVFSLETDNFLGWYENDGTPTEGSWSKHVITSEYVGTALCGRGLYVEDVDSDGDYDVVVARTTVDIISWYENIDDGSSWTKHEISNGSIDYPMAVFANDFNLDGHTDIFATGFQDDSVMLWLQNRSVIPETLIVNIEYNNSAIYFKENDKLRIYANFTEVSSGMNNNSVTIFILTLGDGDLAEVAMNQTNITNYYYDWTIPPGSDDDGTFTVTVNGSDNATNSVSQTSSTKKIDNSGPLTTIGVPISGKWYASMNTISGNATDGTGAGVNTVNITVYNQSSGKYWNFSGTPRWATGVNWTTASGTTSWSKTTNTITWFNSSTYIINATAKDNA